jgi:hypothetical protein
VGSFGCSEAAVLGSCGTHSHPPSIPYWLFLWTEPKERPVESSGSHTGLVPLLAKMVEPLRSFRNELKLSQCRLIVKRERLVVAFSV